ncbi:Putative carboxylesterase, type B, carboxylesterase type B, active, alpha/Beta hydrolase [Septoria linicola]|uniref:Carboxylic ester hydrolase n=1 Tax=Septoria linicola TaxID=215465 RepID=A0A9Q9B253_9PEZI|nr:putative carboxylesterase, type B, carboxylesterase type B, active, alpha/Beta hydrolase [Septoria linicola]USW57533.1 Putative carboxylesterase, type B, carboxylesterase type B, active, alpha/Beta hydrolase [Septoria linicola]
MKTLLLICLGAVRGVASSSGHDNGLHGLPLIKTSSGFVQGHAALNRSSVVEYLGIKYAHPANGSLRFAPPEAYKSNTVIEASSLSPDCPANIAPVVNYPPLTAPDSSVLQKFLFQNNKHMQSEDCLSLNIWTKSPGRVKKSRAVLLFDHGGRFQIPGSNSPFYNGHYLADEEDVVVVTFNKRESILGYPGATPNLGLLDFRLVVEWVRDNIAHFGGDVHRITIWGQSAGGVAVDTYAYAYAKHPVVAGIIADSGLAFNRTPTYPAE